MPQRLVGIVACSGECCSLGTMSRMAARSLIDDLRKSCLTICLPLFIIGDKDENDFAKRFPTISIDGCSKKCATVATEKLSGTVADQLDVSERLEEWGIEKDRFNRRDLGEEGLEVARRLALTLAEKVDVIVEAEKD
jgi:uncharacterized metal-binding protein